MLDYQAGDIVGLQLLDNVILRPYYFRIQAVEQPIVLLPFSLGAVNAMDVAGSGWSEIQDAQNRYYLEPEHEGQLYRIFWGVSPGQAWVYQRYPPNADMLSLLGVRTVGSGVGHIDGFLSPFGKPSPLTQLWTMKGSHPAFLGYHPYGTPSSITVRLSFGASRYYVEFLGVGPVGVKADDELRLASDEHRRLARLESVGSRLLTTPSWISQLARRT